MLKTGVVGFSVGPMMSQHGFIVPGMKSLFWSGSQVQSETSQSPHIGCASIVAHLARQVGVQFIGFIAG